MGELVNLNIDDVLFSERECVVLGKGDSERIVYFDAKTKIHLQKYLESRKDNNSALFVSLRKPHDRLGIPGVEKRMRKLGHEAKIKRYIHISSEEEWQQIQLIKECLLNRFKDCWACAD